VAVDGMAQTEPKAATANQSDVCCQAHI
jgi:hypothetical protein